MTDLQKYLSDNPESRVVEWGGYPDKSGEYETYGYVIVSGGTLWFFNSDGSLNKTKAC